MSLDHDERSTALLGAALSRVATPAWSLLLADPDSLQPPADLKCVRLGGVAGSTPVDVHVVGGATLVWIVTTTEDTVLPAAFCDGGSAFIIDLGIVELVASDPPAVLAGLGDALDTTLVIIGAEPDQPPTPSQTAHRLEVRPGQRRPA